MLVDNSAKYTPRGEEIILSYGKNERGKPYLQVQDLGQGISGEELPHIFERFYRSDEVRRSAGTGLGLSIAKWIVDKHGGHFEVLSREGLGTRIRIVL
ncbi:MAG: sensor histidine kinase [Lachnospiraceae bacterium]|nr:sensor histidine kinase [Lachnospiraceae bacterium]